jgi:hypothetical protein
VAKECVLLVLLCLFHLRHHFRLIVIGAPFAADRHTNVAKENCMGFLAVLDCFMSVSAKVLSPKSLIFMLYYHNGDFL